MITAQKVFNNAPSPQSISQGLLNIECKQRSNQIKWNGQFSPQFVEQLVLNFTNISDTIWDPFSGSGTTLIEASQLNRNAVGTEINPAAFFLSRVYSFSELNELDRNQHLKKFEVEHLDLPNLLLSDPLERFDIQRLADENIVHHLIAVIRSAFIVYLDVFKNPPIIKNILSKWASFKRMILEIPHSAAKIHIHLADARKSGLKSRSVNCVITSPPYINVFNYHQQYRASVEILHGSVLGAAKSEIGSNRKFRSNRFNTVTQYCIDMNAVFDEISRVVVPNGTVIFVVGRESNVGSTPFFNGDIVGRVATECSGFSLIEKMERWFMNRFGLTIYEDILVFTNTRNLKTAEAHSIAKDTLTEALERCPDKSSPAISEAISMISSIPQSPILESNNV